MIAADGEELMDGWPRLRDAGSAALRDARLQVHYAAQLAAAPGKALAVPEPDYGHTALVWLPGAAALAGPVVEPGVRAAVRPEDLILLLLDRDGEPAASLPLPGTELPGGIDWLAGELAALREEPVELDPVRKDLPGHPLAGGAAFAPAGSAAHEEIARLFAGTASLLAARRAEADHPSPVRCWPHHFDVAVLDVLDPGADPEEARSIGYGMTPGDDQYPDPYWYVTPWPYPDPARLGALPAGGWHTEGWVGGVLHAGEVVTAADQRAVVDAFFAAAGAAGRAALGA